jgi:ubiquinone/menaquinone biosynthesis C-methylase UbiE
MDPKRIVQRGYDLMAQDHHDWAQVTRADERARYTALVVDSLPPGSVILDLGCGSGVPTTRALAQHFGVTGVDISQRQIELARQNVPEARFLQADATQLGLSKHSLDAVVAFYSIIHVPRSEQPALVRKIATWLRPGGLFVASLGTHAVKSEIADDFLGAPMYWSGFDAATNQRMIENAGFEILRAVEETEPEFGMDVAFLWVVAHKKGSI